MKLGFHYHVPAYKDKEGNIYTHGYLGVFLDGLADECEILHCFLHSPPKNKEKDCDYKIQAKNVRLTDIGVHRSLIYRSLLAFTYASKFTKVMPSLDAMLIRGPSPLLPLVSGLSWRNNINYSILLVGDYLKSFEAVQFKNPFKKALLKIIYKINTSQQNRYLKNAVRITNNPVITEELKACFGKSFEVRTTTLRESDLYHEEKSFVLNNETFKILSVGRLEAGKGVDDIIKAVSLLKAKGNRVSLDIVGWDPSDNQHYLNYLIALVKQLGIESVVNFSGRKQLGSELFQCYRKSDVFVVASTGNEGFPRTIWEAMSQRTPVVATKVGSIPLVLNDGKDVLLIDKRSPDQIAESILKLHQSHALQEKLSTNGFKLAETNTIKMQSQALVNIIKGEVHAI